MIGGGFSDDLSFGAQRVWDVVSAAKRIPGSTLSRFSSVIITLAKDAKSTFFGVMRSIDTKFVLKVFRMYPGSLKGKALALGLLNGGSSAGLTVLFELFWFRGPDFISQKGFTRNFITLFLSDFLLGAFTTGGMNWLQKSLTIMPADAFIEMLGQVLTGETDPEKIGRRCAMASWSATHWSGWKWRTFAAPGTNWSSEILPGKLSNAMPPKFWARGVGKLGYWAIATGNNAGGYPVYFSITSNLSDAGEQYLRAPYPWWREKRPGNFSWSNLVRLESPIVNSELTSTEWWGRTLFSRSYPRESDW